MKVSTEVLREDRFRKGIVRFFRLFYEGWLLKFSLKRKKHGIRKELIPKPIFYS
jgi:hypothetical protein